MQKILVYSIAALLILFTGCAGTADQPLSSPQDAQLILDALPGESAIDSTIALTAIGKDNLKRIRNDLKTLAASTSKLKKDSRSGLKLSKVQKEVITFTKKRNKAEWNNDLAITGSNSNNCSKQCLSNFNSGSDGCNRLSGLSAATCSANVLTIYFLCLSNCSGTMPL